MLDDVIRKENSSYRGTVEALKFKITRICSDSDINEPEWASEILKIDSERWEPETFTSAMSRELYKAVQDSASQFEVEQAGLIAEQENIQRRLDKVNSKINELNNLGEELLDCATEYDEIKRNFF